MNPKDIRVGMLTAPLRNLAFEEVLDLARRCNIAALEVVTEPGNPHIDPMTLGPAQVAAIKQKLRERRLEISALSNFMNITAPGKSGEVPQAMIKTVDAAVLLGVATVCMNLGTPVQGMSRINTTSAICVTWVTQECSASSTRTPPSARKKASGMERII
jgi:sugar phosphate isomerase/epimerase